MKLERIVIGTDFTPGSIAAAQWTRRDLAPSAELTVVHVVEPAAAPGEVDLAMQRLSTLREMLGSANVSIELRIGNAASQLAEVAAELHADLVVVGPHSDHPGRTDILGSTAQRLVHCAPVPVLLATGTRSGPPVRLLIPVAGSDISAAAFDWARSLEDRFDARIDVVHMASTESDVAGRRDRRRVPRWRKLAATRQPDRVFVDAVTGDPPSIIPALAARFGTDLVVMDAVADGVLRTATCPVLVVGSGS